jgi:hypothetical protein
MRKDMKDLLLDTGRVGGGWGKGAGARRYHLKNDDPDDLSNWQPSSRKRVAGHKHQGDRLNPLKRYLKRNCGRPWSEVYAEICEFADSRTIRGFHLRQHVWQYVVPNNYDVGHKGRYGPFFVDPDGVLQEEKSLTHAERRKLWKTRELRNRNPYLSIDSDHHWEKIEGFWYYFETTHVTYTPTWEDLEQDPMTGEVKIIRVQGRPYTDSYTSKRQVNGKTQKMLDAKWEAYLKGL